MILNANTGSHASYQPDRCAERRRPRAPSEISTRACVGPLETRFAWTRRRQRAKRAPTVQMRS